MSPEKGTPHKIFDGRDRIIYAPVPELRAQLRNIKAAVETQLFRNQTFYELWTWESIHGFVPWHNNKTHARVHREAQTILQLDIKRAFESTPRAKVMKALKGKADGVMVKEIVDSLFKN